MDDSRRDCVQREGGRQGSVFRARRVHGTGSEPMALSAVMEVYLIVRSRPSYVTMTEALLDESNRG